MVEESSAVGSKRRDSEQMRTEEFELWREENEQASFTISEAQCNSIETSIKSQNW